MWGSPFYQPWARIWEALFAAPLLSEELSLFYWSLTLKTDSTTTCHSNRGAAHRIISYTNLETKQQFCSRSVVTYGKHVEIFGLLKQLIKTTTSEWWHCGQYMRPDRVAHHSIVWPRYMLPSHSFSSFPNSRSIKMWQKQEKNTLASTGSMKNHNNPWNLSIPQWKCFDGVEFFTLGKKWFL